MYSVIRLDYSASFRDEPLRVLPNCLVYEQLASMEGAAVAEEFLRQARISDAEDFGTFRTAALVPD